MNIVNFTINPKAIIVYKNIKGVKRPYLQWKENGKTMNKYLNSDIYDEVKALIDKKKEKQY